MPFLTIIRLSRAVQKKKKRFSQLHNGLWLFRYYSQAFAQFDMKPNEKLLASCICKRASKLLTDDRMLLSVPFLYREQLSWCQLTLCTIQMALCTRDAVPGRRKVHFLLAEVLACVSTSDAEEVEVVKQANKCSLAKKRAKQGNARYSTSINCNATSTFQPLGGLGALQCSMPCSNIYGSCSKK